MLRISYYRTHPLNFHELCDKHHETAKKLSSRPKKLMREMMPLLIYVGSKTQEGNIIADI